MSDRLSIFELERGCLERVALVDEHGTMTYQELARAAAARVKDLDFGDRDRVLVIPRRSREDVALLHGLLARGIPIVLGHARWTTAEIRDVADRASVRALVVDGRVELMGGTERGPEQVIVPTSGSEGRPKLVRLSRRALAAAARAHAEALPWVDDDRWVLTLPLGHIGGFSILTRSLWARRAVVLGPAHFDAEKLLDLVERARGTLLSLVPTMLERLVASGPPPASVRAALLGGAASSAALVDRARRAGWPILPTYGSSETTAQVCTQRLGDERPEGVGLPLPGIEVRVRGGRVEVRGPTLMDGYVGEEDIHGWYRTADLGRLDSDGQLHVLGRADAQIVSGGENVDPAEVEAALRTHPAVARACVLGLEDERWGEVVAAAVVREAPVDAAELREHLARVLAPFKHPRRWSWLSSLPELAPGKLDRRAVRASFATNDAE